jgi:hypothetical protein
MAAGIEKKYTFVEYNSIDLPDNRVRYSLAAADFGRCSGARPVLG